MSSLIWLIVIVLVVLWALGAFVVNVGGLVHLVLIGVLILVAIAVFQSLTGRRGHG